jgi:hypothetical protein
VTRRPASWINLVVKASLVLLLFALKVDVGAVTAIPWELGEYFAFIRNSPELATAYTDTLGDLSLGLSGSTLAATLAVVVARRR